MTAPVPAWQLFQDGCTLLGHAVHGNSKRDMDEAITKLSQAVDLHGSMDNSANIPAGSYVEWLTMLGAALCTRRGLFGDEGCRNDVIKRLRALVPLCPLDHPLCFNFYIDLAASLLGRYDDEKQQSDVDDAIFVLQNALNLYPPNSDELWKTHANLCRAFVYRYEMSKDEQSFEAARRHYQEAVRLSTVSDPDFWKTLLPWGRAYALRSEVSQDIRDLDEAIRLHREAVDLCSADDPERHACLQNLGDFLLARFRWSGVVHDQDEAIKVHEETLKLLPEGAVYTRTLHCLATCLAIRFELSGDVRDLEEASRKHESAIGLHYHLSAADRANGLTDYANVLQRQFELLSQSSGELDKVISVRRDAVELQTDGDLRPRTLHALGEALRHRNPSPETLSEAIKHYRQALVERSPNNRDLNATLLHNLAVALAQRAEQDQEIQDFDESVERLKQASTLWAHSPIKKCITLYSIGSVYQTRFHRSQHPNDDLNECIRYNNEAQALIPSEHPFHGRILASLASAYLCSESPPDNPFNLFVRAVAHRATPVQHRFSTALTWVEQARQRDHDSLIQAYTQALSLLDLSLMAYPTAELQRWRLIGMPRSFASDACAAAIEKGRLDIAIELLDQGRCLLWTRLTRYRRPLDVLRKVAPELATEFEESSRELEVLATSSSGVSSSGGLPGPDRASSKIVALDQNDLPGTSRGSRCGQEIQVPQNEAQIRARVDLQMQHLHKATERWENLINRIRQLEGYDNFLKAVPFSELQKAAVDGPIIVINVSKYRSDAIIVRNAHPPVLIPLPWATPDSLDKLSSTLNVSLNNLHRTSQRHPALTSFLSRLRSWLEPPSRNPLSSNAVGIKPFLQAKLKGMLRYLWGRIVEYIPHRWFHSRPKTPVNSGDLNFENYHREQIRSVLRSLWSCIVKPVAEKLAELQYETLSRVWLYPTGALCRLPLHAAGPYDGRGPNFCDLYISSYVTTFARSLDSLSDRSDETRHPSPHKMLVVGMPDQLPNAEKETNIIRDLSSRRTPSLATTVLLGNAATRDEMERHLQDHSWVHLVCHGHQLQDSPFDSFFQLQDGQKITLMDLMGWRLPRAELAFLGACNTATGDFNKTPDEFIHLAAAMQFCGFRSVIGTLWPMRDKDGPPVSREFYKYMFREGATADYRDSAKALHDAVKSLRRRNVPIEAWIHFVHFGL